MNDSSEIRRWIAYELHDRLMPWIHGARMQLTNIESSLDHKSRLEIAEHCLAIAAEEGRSLIAFLESDQAQQVDSLKRSIEQFIELTQPLANQQEQRLVIGSRLELPENMPAEVTWPILRIVQQAVLNAVQHAGPCEIVVEGKTLSSGTQSTNPSPTPTVEIRITDSGRGFDPNQRLDIMHYGLSSMKQRAESIKAALQIDSAAGKGTCVVLTRSGTSQEPSGT